MTGQFLRKLGVLSAAAMALLPAVASAQEATSAPGQPMPGQFHLQPSVTPIMDSITVFHDGILLWTAVLITILVLALLVIFGFWVVVPLLIAGLFFGFKYALKGAAGNMGAVRLSDEASHGMRMSTDELVREWPGMVRVLRQQLEQATTAQAAFWKFVTDPQNPLIDDYLWDTEHVGDVDAVLSVEVI